ncbi:bifunctional UDP-N-acetylglucosamine diphosphorylase/glucosamine-1-phosphate N-acetyltransferase GlmU [Marichromatium bheemlicum]|uniref:Bifunctional protein GlmU n=1 Tax=Marichromatium bheemlicum TaxID=365339 RepID=A0ABX1I5R0_9GAMM|nr:bifunctional UDP-N-acetylglucosamine diphosphorylase/glucosamine-1-phosphate N-acetyltransferase GlmU [Marichromatium bheemlicum]NKN32917.1 bifunctional UDP-N-acetylglucosamine diphosphorylase/glucosamine-1-phosphate N-acetyltransferase GlmU [Marichromatium bheemlicum]
MKLGVVILAAGLGKRMRSKRPKVLHPLAGRPLLGHVLEAAMAIKPTRIVVVHGHAGEQVRAALGDVPCTWVEQAEQRGTAHAVMQAMPELADLDRVLVLYGDVPLISPTTLERLIAAAETTPLALLTADLPDPTGYGRILRDPTGRIERIVEERDADAQQRRIRESNTGFLVADRACLADWLSRIDDDNAQGEYYLTDVTALAAADGISVASARPDSLTEVSGVNDRVQLAALERAWQRHQAEQLMRAGVTLQDPTRFDLRGRLSAASDCTIDVNVVIEGEVEIAEGVHIGPNCVLRDCAIGANTEILANCVIEGARVGADARIGPFARLRPGSELADATHVGNFVETKNTRLGAGSKANHLTYLGDASIGAGVNIGAGTITCNYDGVNKSRTEIGEGAFIGSNSALVAPVTIGAGATIGAGSVITRHAPAEQLTLSRARQHSISSWQRPQKQQKS